MPPRAKAAAPLSTAAATGGDSAPSSSSTRAKPPPLHGSFDEASWAKSAKDGYCPLKFGSRLNSMKDRADLWKDEGPLDWKGLVARQGTVEGLDLVDFNYPQHVKDVSAEDAKAALDEAGLKAGAICMRYEKEHGLGALTHPDEGLRRKAIDMTVAGGKYALALGANELVIWSAFDGYDYQLQVDYTQLWDDVVSAFQEICDALPDVRVSLEFKPTDEHTRFFIVPSTGAALLLANQIDRPNFGLTLDIGHMIMAGENPAQSVSLVGRAGKLFGVQLNDGHAKLGAEDGLMFGSVHSSMAIEFLRGLQEVKFDGHLYFDTFPRNEDPVRECAYNIRRVKTLWAKAARLTREGVAEHLKKHDALGSLEMLEEMEEGGGAAALA